MPHFITTTSNRIPAVVIGSQLHFFLSWLEALCCHPGKLMHHPTLGPLLCKRLDHHVTGGYVTMVYFRSPKDSTAAADTP
jgi:hypothetical protein